MPSVAAAVLTTCVWTVLLATAWSQGSPTHDAVRPQDLQGWDKTQWRMSEAEVKRLIHGRWRSATKQEREEDRDVYAGSVLQDVKIAGRNCTGFFGFSRSDRQLARVAFQCGRFPMPNTEASLVFDRLLADLQVQFGVPSKVGRNNSGHTGVYADYALWRFPSTIVELTSLKPNDTERAVVVAYSRVSDNQP